MDRTSEFFRGIAGGVRSGRGNPLDFFFFLLLIALIILVVWAISKLSNQYLKGRKFELKFSFPSLGPDFFKTGIGLNALQRKILCDLIKEFKQREMAAEGIPASILEKFGEFLYANMSKLKVSDREARNFININYPLLKGYNVELDLQREESISLISSRVLNVTNHYIQVELPSSPDLKLFKGMDVYINYSVGKRFLRGKSIIMDIRKDNILVLKKPDNFILSNERLYSRIPLKNVSGRLYNPKTSMNYDVEILDISFEGARLSTQYTLQKNIAYQLSFDTRIEDRVFSFSNLECLVLKNFIGSGGKREYGVAFMYLGSDVRGKLSLFIKELALQIQKQKNII